MFRTTLSSFVLVSLLALSGTASADQTGTPFRGRATGAIVASSPVAIGLSIQTEATGEATRIGHFTRTEVLLLDPVTSTVAGLVTFTTDNGDTLNGVVSGTFVSPTQVTGHYRFTGGTGRFAGVGGKAAFVLDTPDGVSFAVTFKGHLDGRAR